MTSFQKTYRRFKTNSLSSTLNVANLAIAFTVILSCHYFIQSESQTDDFIVGQESIYRLVREVKSSNSYESPTLALPYDDLIKTSLGIPEQQITKVFKDDELVTIGTESFFEDNFIYSDRSFFSILSYPFLHGNPETALAKQNSVVISAIIAKKYFGNQNPIGKLIEIDKKETLEVTGVVTSDNIKSHLPIDLVANIESLGYTKKYLNDKNTHWLSYYLQLTPEKFTEVSTQLDSFSEDFLMVDSHEEKAELRLQPFDQIYFDRSMKGDIALHGNEELNMILLVICVLVLIVSLTTSLNLKSLSLAKRTKEVGIRKIMGASQNKILQSWLFDSLFNYTVALGTALLLSNYFIKYVGQRFELSINTPNLLELVIICTILVGLSIISSTLFPAIIYSSTAASSALKGNSKITCRGRFQYVVLGFQFLITTFLIGASIVISKQFIFMQNKEVGLDTSQILLFDSNNRDSWRNRNQILQEITELPSVSNSGMIYGGLPTTPIFQQSFRIGEKTYSWNSADFEPPAIKTLGIQLVEGAYFNSEIKSEIGNTVLINETAAVQLGWPANDILGRQLTDVESKKNKKIIGIVSDFHFQSFKKKIEPLVIHSTRQAETFVVKLNNLSEMDKIAAIWRNYVPKYPFDYRFLDQSFSNFYKKDRLYRLLIITFAAMACLVSLMGSISIFSIIHQAKNKEISIRMVLGASEKSILLRFSQKLLIALGLGGAIGIPVTLILATRWLTNFSYRIEFYSSHVIVGFILLAVTIMSSLLIYQKMNSTKNPADMLRSND